jgi:hypothetical protein
VCGCGSVGTLPVTSALVAILQAGGPNLVISEMAVAATGVGFCTMVGATASTASSVLHRTAAASSIPPRCVHARARHTTLCEYNNVNMNRMHAAVARA